MASEHRSAHEYGNVIDLIDIRKSSLNCKSDRGFDSKSNLSNRKASNDSILESPRAASQTSKSHESFKPNSDQSYVNSKQTRDPEIKTNSKTSFKKSNVTSKCSDVDALNTPVLNTGASKQTLHESSDSSDLTSDSESDLDLDEINDPVRQSTDSSTHILSNDVNIKNVTSFDSTKSYMSEKDKFLMALNKSSNLENVTEEKITSRESLQHQSMQSQKDLFEQALLQQKKQEDFKNATLLDEKSHSFRGTDSDSQSRLHKDAFQSTNGTEHQQQVVKANVVVDHLFLEKDM